MLLYFFSVYYTFLEYNQITSEPDLWAQAHFPWSEPPSHPAESLWLVWELEEDELLLVFFSNVVALWSRAYLHSVVMNGVTTGLGGVKRRFMGAQRSSSHILCATIHMIEVFVRSLQNIKLPECASSLSLTEGLREICTSVRG